MLNAHSGGTIGAGNNHIFETEYSSMASPRPTVLPPALIESQALDRLTTQHLTRLIRKTVAPNTQRAYESALVYWRAWHELRYAQPLTIPLKASAILQFLSDHVPDGIDGYSTMPIEVDAVLRERDLRRAGFASLAGIRRYLAAIAWAHSQAWSDDCGWRTPLDEPVVIAFVRKLTAIYATHNIEPTQKSGATRDELQAMLATCDADLVAKPLPIAWRQHERTLAAYRDRALLLFGWASGGRRRSEIAGATMDRLTRQKHAGQLAYTYRLGLSKTTRRGQVNNDKPIKGTAAVALDAWLRFAGIEDGRIFRSITAGTLGDSITDKSIARIIEKRAKRAGLAGNWGGHSLRSGFITQANLDAVPDAETMALSEHKSRQQLIRYHRRSAPLTSVAGDLFDRKKS